MRSLIVSMNMFASIYSAGMAVKTTISGDPMVLLAYIIIGTISASIVVDYFEKLIKDNK